MLFIGLHELIIWMGNSLQLRFRCHAIYMRNTMMVLELCDVCGNCHMISSDIGLFVGLHATKVERVKNNINIE